MEKKDVLKTIMNVKKYTQNLKKNATLSQIQCDEGQQSDDQRMSNIQTYSHHRNQHTQLASPTLGYNLSSSIREDKIKISKLDKFGESFSRNKRNMNSTLTMNNQYFDKIDLHKDRSVQLNHRNPPRDLFNHQQQLDNINQHHQVQLIKNLHTQIKILKAQIEKYQRVILIIKRKYIQMELLCSQKHSVDHYVDVLKEELNEQRQKNDKLTKIIEKQRNQINKFNENINKISEQLTEIHSNQINTLNKINKQNNVLRQILLLNNISEHDQIIQKRLKQISESHKHFNDHPISIRIPSTNVQEIQAKWVQPQQLF